MIENLLTQIKEDMRELCVLIGPRPVGSLQNRQATGYVTGRLASLGFSVTESGFECLDWEAGDIVLTVGEKEVKALVGSYTLPCDVKSGFVTAATIAELSGLDAAGKIIVLHGELCKEQLMPKNFIFYNPDHHKQIIRLLEEKNPLAVVAITGRNPELAGAVYPFPLIEDGDFDIPHAYLTEEEGEILLSQTGKELHLSMVSRRIPSKGYNVVAVKKGQRPERIVCCAHIDTKKTTPGALDNAGGVTILLTLAGLLQDYEGKYTIELVVLNGEDYYAYSGGMQYLADNQDSLDQILLAVNADGAGYRDDRTTYCWFNASETICEAVRNAFRDNSRFAETEPWYQSDHSMFAMNGRPAIALTSEDFKDIWANIAHTEQDTIDIVNTESLSAAAGGIKALITELNETL